MQLLLRRCQIGLGVLLAVVRDLQLALGNRALIVKNFRSLILGTRESLVVDRLQVLIEGIGDVRALHLHEQLALLDEGAELGVDGNHPAGGDRNNRDGARDVGVDCPGYIQRRSRGILRGRRDRKAVWVIDGDQADAALTLHLRGEAAPRLPYRASRRRNHPISRG